MGVEENKALIRRWVAAFNAGDLEAIDEVYAPTYIDHTPRPGQAPGPAGVREALVQVRTSFPDIHIMIMGGRAPESSALVRGDAPMSATENARLIRDAFTGWAEGAGDIFGLLADDLRWTVTGSSPLAGTYAGRAAFLEDAVRPIAQRLSVPIRPTVRTIVAEGDDVVVLWEGRATARDGRPYDNTYCWLLQVIDGRIVEGTAFFDTPPLTDLLARIALPTPS